MNSLSKNKIKIEWIDLLVGFENRWINSYEIDYIIFNDELNKCSEDFLITLNIEKDSTHDVFYNILLNGIKKIYNNKNLLDLSFTSEHKWFTSFLLEIKNSSKNKYDKLKDVAYLWEKLKSPNEWKPFIYYLPVELNQTTNVEILYSKLESYIEDCIFKHSIKFE
ncbi:MAG: DUF2247 family protein [Bacteroidales bacterium]|nr:DUF2247 family protein [Bacteroidales bacterium]